MNHPKTCKFCLLICFITITCYFLDTVDLGNNSALGKLKKKKRSKSALLAFDIKNEFFNARLTSLLLFTIISDNNIMAPQRHPYPNLWSL